MTAAASPASAAAHSGTCAQVLWLAAATASRVTAVARSSAVEPVAVFRYVSAPAASSSAITAPAVGCSDAAASIIAVQPVAVAASTAAPAASAALTPAASPPFAALRRSFSGAAAASASSSASVSATRWVDRMVCGRRRSG